MRFVLAALSRPITVVVAFVSIALFAYLAVQRMPVDIFRKWGRTQFTWRSLSEAWIRPRWRATLPTITSITSST